MMHGHKMNETITKIFDLVAAGEINIPVPRNGETFEEFRDRHVGDDVAGELFASLPSYMSIAEFYLMAVNDNVFRLNPDCAASTKRFKSHIYLFKYSDGSGICADTGELWQ